jgi:hypothetical protein
MKNLIITMISVLMLSGCSQEVNENTLTERQNKIDRTTGEQIPLQVADRWIQAYNSQYENSGRVANTNHYAISAAEIQSLANPNLFGIAFHHALDNNGIHHILAIGIDETKHLWSTVNNRPCIDANNNTLIERSIAKEWTENYKASHPSEVWYHFFGQDTFNEMKNIAFFKEVEIVPALNDEQVPQLLLVIEDLDSRESSRMMDTDNPESIIVYDKGGVCPPCE